MVRQWDAEWLGLAVFPSFGRNSPDLMLKVDLGPFCVIELSLSRGGEDAEDESIVHGPVDTKTRLQLIGERLDGVGLLMFAPMDPASRQKITQSPETKQTLLLKALFNRGFFLAS